MAAKHQKIQEMQTSTLASGNRQGGQKEPGKGFAIRQIWVRILTRAPAGFWTSGNQVSLSGSKLRTGKPASWGERQSNEEAQDSTAPHGTKKTIITTLVHAH